jgi:hypothetical protein
MNVAPDPHDIARQYSLAAVRTLVSALDNSDARAAVQAAIALLKFGHGQPPLPVSFDTTTGISVEVHTAESDVLHCRANGKDADKRPKAT